MSFRTKEYFIKETYKSIRRNGFMSFASVSTVVVSLLVLGMFLLIFLNTDNLAKHLEKQVQISVYMEDSATGGELETMREELEKLPGVVEVEAVTKEEALERFKERLGDQDKLLDSLGSDNPFPYSFEVHLDKPEHISEITEKIAQLPKVETARFGQEIVEHLFNLTKTLRIGGVILIFVLFMATLFIISNTIRLTVFARRKEVLIMRYVGATDWFIRWPFLLEGMSLGFMGALVASLVLNNTYVALSHNIHATLAFLPIMPAYPLMYYVDIFLILAGTGIGALGSYISLRHFLRV